MRIHISPLPPISARKLLAHVQHRVLLKPERLKLRKEVPQGDGAQLAPELIHVVEVEDYRGGPEPRGITDGVEKIEVRLEFSAEYVGGEGLVVAGEVGDEDEGGYVGGLGGWEWKVRDGSSGARDVEDEVVESVMAEVELTDAVMGGGGDSSVLGLALCSETNALQDVWFTAVRGTERKEGRIAGIAGKKLSLVRLAVVL